MNLLQIADYTVPSMHLSCDNRTSIIHNRYSAQIASKDVI